ncbi:MAG: phosphoribosylaminoimidazolesuccinocarboxamide synthase [Bacteroidales bacterium]|nr:phosphoribosylaminoimidazolesuccinocarboxamide synthase [Bacteroidales bacterium]
MNPPLVSSNFNFGEKQNVYHGKVRDVYTVDDLLIMIVSDRISAFDVVLPEGIPYKGQVLNKIAERFLDATEDIVPNWKMAVPHPSVMVGRYAEPFKVEMVIRGYLTGHAWREYKAGKRSLCGVPMPDGMVENQKFEKPILTPTTKEDIGHDEDISREDIIKHKLVSEEDYAKLEEYTYKLFERGTEMAADKGLILVDTKYEFGKVGDEIILIDEIHTPDSSRYFYLDTYEELQAAGKPQRQLSKEFVREWLMENGFQGKEGQQVPKMHEYFIHSVATRYIELYEKIIGEEFVKTDGDEIHNEIEAAVKEYLKTL